MTTTVGGQSATQTSRFRFQVTGGQKTTSKTNFLWLEVNRQLRRIRTDKLFRSQTPAHVIFNLEHGDLGSNFETVNNSFRLWPRAFSHKATYGLSKFTYRGSLMPVNKGLINPSDVLWPTIDPPSPEYLFGLGGTAVSRSIPTAPAVDLAVALGELREGLPNLVGSNLKDILRVNRRGDRIALRHPRNNRVRVKRTGKAKAVGGEYLNYTFGILPLLSDIRKLNQAVVDYDNIVKQFLRDSDRMIRRRYDFPTTEDESVVWVKSNQAVWPSLDTRMYKNAVASSGLGTLTLTRKVKIETWFSGAFTYHVDVGADALSAISRQAAIVRRVYGVKLTPDVAWNLAPWSWAADWFANTGDVLKNVSLLASDGLVMRYGYLMYRETVTDTYTHTGVSFQDKPTGTISCSFTTTYKRRVKAHPYGFGVTDASLNARQIAILAALGLTKTGG